MKKLLLLIAIIISFNLLSQTNDTIILKTGEIIPCKVLNISKSGLVTYNFVESNGDLGMAEKGKALIKEIKLKDSLFVATKKRYQTWISLNNTIFNVKGTLYKIKDSSILVMKVAEKNVYSVDRSEMIKIQVNYTETIKVRRNGNIGRGFLIGALSGVAVGTMIGFIKGDDPKEYWIRFSAEDYALIYGITLGIGGGLLGGAIGSAKIKIPINGSFENFNKERSRLKKYSLQ
jgi:hypothetical protein